MAAELLVVVAAMGLVCLLVSQVYQALAARLDGPGSLSDAIGLTQAIQSLTLVVFGVIIIRLTNKLHMVVAAILRQEREMMLAIAHLYACGSAAQALRLLNPGRSASGRRATPG